METCGARGMTFICEEVINLPKGVIIADHPKDLVSFREPNCAAAVWERQLMPEFQSWLNDIPSQNLPEGRLILRVEDVPDAIVQLCEIAGTKPSTHRDLLVNDIAALTELFASLVGSKYIRVRLDKITDNACSKFHKDAITARLVCTYRGTGTQYGTLEDSEEPLKIHTAPTGAPILLRGKLWPEKPDSGLCHRSPPIDGTGETRLVLVIDPVTDPDRET
jgi:hypothetical protein